MAGHGNKANLTNAGKGRKKGVPNKSTSALKDAIMNAFNKVGGQMYLERVAEDDPKTFCTLLGRILPQELKADIEANHKGLPETINIRVISSGDK